MPEKFPDVMPANPHILLLRVNPKGELPAIDRCAACGETGTFSEVMATECPHVRPPCPTCGGSPLCERDCKAVIAAITGNDVYLGGTGDIVARDEQQKNKPKPELGACLNYAHTEQHVNTFDCRNWRSDCDRKGHVYWEFEDGSKGDKCLDCGGGDK